MRRREPCWRGIAARMAGLLHTVSAEVRVYVGERITPRSNGHGVGVHSAEQSDLLMLFKTANHGVQFVPQPSMTFIRSSMFVMPSASMS